MDYLSKEFIEELKLTYKTLFRFTPRFSFNFDKEFRFYYGNRLLGETSDYSKEKLLYLKVKDIVSQY